MYNDAYKRIVKESPVAYFLTKAIKDENGIYTDLTIVDMNKSFEKLVRLDEKDLINRNISEFGKNKDLHKNILKAIENTKFSYELYSEVLNQYLNVEIYSMGDDNFAIRFLQIDKERIKLSKIVSDSPFCAWIKDKDGIYIDVNKKFLQRSGKKYTEVIGSTDFDLWPGEASVYKEQDEHVLKHKELYGYQEIIKFGKPSQIYYETTKWPYVDVHNNIIGVAGMSIEIVDKLELRKNLKKNEENFIEIINHSEEVFFITDKEKITYISPSFKNLFGEEPDSLYKDIRGWRNFVSEEDSKKVTYDFENTYEGIFKIITKQNKSKWIWTKIIPIKDERGNTIKSIGIISDVSKRREVEIEIENMRSEFFGNLSHELRTPINLILSTMQLLELKINKLDSDNDIEYIKKYNKIINQNGLRLLKLVNNLIDTSKIDTGYFGYNPQNHDIISFIENICMSVSEISKQHNIDLIFDTNIEEKMVAFDLDMMERILLNLLSNAIKFNKQDGKIEVCITVDEDIRISVKDNGVGIPDDKIDSVFERFEQAKHKIKQEKEGSGIGLSLVKSLVELHNGDIYVKSNINEGSEFIITIPNIMVDSSNVISNIFEDEDIQVNRMNVEFSDIYM